MHIVHLALGPDVITSSLLDWTDTTEFINESSRDRRLGALFENYREWCESQDYPMGERAQRRLFSTNTLKPDSGIYVELSQKILNATACRYMLFWLASVANRFAVQMPTDENMYPGLRSSIFNFDLFGQRLH